MNRLVRTLLSASSSVILTAVVTPAFGQAAGSAEAEELFKQGRAALEAKDYVTACTKLGESNRLERAVGTLISIAQCEEGQSKLAAARQHWQEAADLADALQDRLNRGATARQKFAELDKRVPRLTVKRAPNAPTSTTVKRDEVSLTGASFGSALPVDPGKHVLVVSADSHESRTFEVTLAEGETKEIEVEPGIEVAPAPPVAPTPLVTAPEQTPPANDGSSTRIAAYTVSGVGIVGLGLGTIFGLRAASKWSSAKSACVPGQCGPTSAAQNDQEDASSAGTISTIAFVVGGAALATGVVLFVLASSSTTKGSPAARVRIVPGAGTIAAFGEF